MAVPAYERVLDLLIALAQTQVAMTRGEIRRNVNGYAPEDGDPRTDAAFERMFERDKEMLKDLGVPLVTLHGTGHYDDIRYRVDLNEYELPDVRLSAAELGALAVASHVWDGSILARTARRGLTKLKGATTTAAEEVFSPSIRLYEPDTELPALFEALTERVPVVFSYAATSTGQETTRTVEPWQLTVKDNGWYLQGWDRDRSAGREFRVSRITSRVRPLQEPFQGPTPEVTDPEHAVTTARVQLRPGAASVLRARGEFLSAQGKWEVYDVPMRDLISFAGELAAYGPRVRVVDPPELRDRVIAKLRGAAVAAGKEPA